MQATASQIFKERKMVARFRANAARRLLAAVMVHVPENSIRKDGRLNAEIADIVEFGTRRMAPRPFRRNAPIVYEDKWRRLRGHCAQAVGDGSMEMQDALNEVGWQMVVDTRNLMLRYGIYDTGQLYRSLRWTVRA